MSDSPPSPPPTSFTNISGPPLPSSSSQSYSSSSTLSTWITSTSESSSTSSFSPPSVAFSDPAPTSTQFPSPSTSETVVSSQTSSSSSSGSHLSSSPSTRSTNQNTASPTLTQSSVESTEAPTNSTSRGFFGNRGAVAATFTLVGIAVLVVLGIFLFRRRRRRTRQRAALTRDLRNYELRISKNSSAGDSFVCSDALHSATAMFDGRCKWEEHSSSTMGKEYMVGFPSRNSTRQRTETMRDTSSDEEKTYPAEISPTFDVNYRDRGPGDTSDSQTHRPTPHSSPYEKGPSDVDHPLTTTRSTAYLLFPDLQRVSQAPSSPSIYPATLSVAEDDDSSYQMFTSTDAACRESGTIPDRVASFRRRSSHVFTVMSEAFGFLSNSGNGRDSPSDSPNLGYQMSEE